MTVKRQRTQNIGGVGEWALLPVPRNADGQECPSSRSNDRRGLALLVVIIALGIASAIGMSLLKMSVKYHRQAAHDVLVVQTQWLAESGIERAVALLRKDDTLEQSTWSIDAKELGGRYSGQVTIVIKPVENSPKRRQITTFAEYPVESPKRIRAEVTRLVDL